MLRDLFNEFIELSNELRPDYRASLGTATGNWTDVLQLSYTPNFYEVIFSTVQGTKRDVCDQRLMDFIPGYRLIHIDEFVSEKQNLDNILNVQTDVAFVLPILANYSSDFICYVEMLNGEGCICTLLHDEGELEVVYNTPEKFLETINEFYKQQAYFLDDEGYLTYDLELEGNIGAKNNPNVNYWVSP
ncbi:SMI1/KNR4 family protein [Cohnella terricola]|uniref:SMI1/KNR4 family protein n=1 Tax=Cohnella terricola TaxID=1289167 RepID=A0A559JQA6_9BACL|nr:SMI1/KNR4 family protein [Cohnella terricola]TVY02061.1 SMI1/KNR4 family protein [Cohnella terricola]